MDSQRFDDLARLLARPRSRRQVLRGLAGAAAGTVLGLAGERDRASAFMCRAGGYLCAMDAQCCSGRCDPATRQCACVSGEILCRDRCIPACTALDQCHVAGQCDPGTGRCANPSLADGTGCSGNDPCFRSYTCQQGTCIGSDPVACTALDQCHVAGVCDHTSGQCTNPPAGAGTACGQEPRCSDGVATGQDTCDGQGNCAAGSTTACAPYVCGATTCLTSCSHPSQCVSGDFCVGNQCVTKLPNGQPCTAAGQCTSGNCVDGVCCDRACTGQCEACNLTGSAGTCTAVTGPPIGGRSPCTGAGTTCGGTCDGTTTASCTYPGSAISCRAASCSDGTETLAATCNGQGTCPAATTQSCGAFRCGSDACLTSCTTDDQCVSGAYCDTSSNTCKQDLPNGTACGADHQCSSGHCVDGVCCNTACTDQCAACNVAGGVGTCSPAPEGTPVGSRPLCTGETPSNSGSASVCGGICDGTHTTCAYPASGTSCGGAMCSGDTFTPAPTCDGAGNCVPGTAKSCAPYLCGTNACQTTCTSFSDCAPGYLCNESSQCAPCTPVGQNCAGSACCAGLICNTTTVTCLANNGQPCTGDGDCQNGHCVSGTCCDQVCGGPCQTCSSGTCTNLAGGQTGGCQNGQTCQGGQCVTPCLGLQTACTDASQCCQTLYTVCETVGTGTQTECCRPPGIFCNETADCCGDGTCGTTSFGANHCCYPEGHSCNADDTPGDCCGSAGCLGGVCCTATCGANECGEVAKCGVLIDCPACSNGEVCNNGTCCTPQTESVTCNGKCGPVKNNCGQTVPCSCDALHNCSNGQCVDCMQLGGTCGYPDYASGCCQATGTTSCESNLTSGDQNVCCHHVSGSCSGDYQCCGAAQCGSNGTCCYPLNFQDCSSSDQCCNGLVCADSICCTAQGGSCGSDGDCCSGSCPFGTCACSPFGKPCASSSDCCAGGTCCSGYCRDLDADPYNCGSCGNNCGTDCFGDQVLCCAGLGGCCAHC